MGRLLGREEMWKQITGALMQGAAKHAKIIVDDELPEILLEDEMYAEKARDDVTMDIYARYYHALRLFFKREELGDLMCMPCNGAGAKVTESGGTAFVCEYCEGWGVEKEPLRHDKPNE
tara:strand:- start:886 stop:1242 length:357 start_codon:yes stop_codon:yes gene_type:complete